MAYIDKDKIPYYLDTSEEAPMEGRKIAFKSDIDKIPTADVEEVKHGEWIPYEQPCGVGYSIPNYKPTHYCSNCKGLGWEFYGKCPHCGASMKGEIVNGSFIR